MNKGIAPILLMFVINSCLYAQTGVDYYPKSLKSELKKLNGDATQFQEMNVAEHLARSIRSGKFFRFTNSSASTPVSYLYIGRVNTCRTGGCSIQPEEASDKKSEYFDYFILFDSLLSIRQVKIYNYQATHGYEVTSPNWLKQFKNYDGSKELIAGKNIDAISGATISVDATTFDIEHKTKLLQKMLEKAK